MIYLIHFALAMAMMQQQTVILEPLTGSIADQQDLVVHLQDPIDVPAVEVLDKEFTCHDNRCEKLTRQTCSDPSRYLLGPNGKGEYICHRSQP